MARGSSICLLLAAASLLVLPEALAQSGVLSGPPQITDPGRGPPPRSDGPGLRPQDDPPGGRPGLRSQDEPPGRRPGPGPGLRSQDEPPGSRDRDRDRFSDRGPPSDDRRSTWIAVAGGFDGKGKNVGVGYSGHQPIRSDAEDEALRACNRYGKGVNCREPYAVSDGCLYIVPGTKSGGVTWGRGSTQETALEQCRRGGYNCDRKRIIGGCVAGR
jgi:hypothetical protein